VRSGIPKSGPEAKILVNRAQEVPKDSPSFLFKKDDFAPKITNPC
jgi:hypothetical protein